MIRVGPAGWAYKDWNGIVYPKPKPRGFGPVAYFGPKSAIGSRYQVSQGQSPFRWRSARQRVPAEPSILLPQA